MAKNSVIRYIHEWRHNQVLLVFHTIPMFHIGSSSYYQRINSIFAGLNYLLIEGVHLETKEIGKYRHLAKAAGLETQIDQICIPADIDTLNIDIDSGLFRQALRKLPFLERNRLRFYDLASRTVFLKKKERIHAMLVSYSRYPDEHNIE